MSEMQTLTVQPESKEAGSKKVVILEEIKIDSVDLKTKYKILDWLI